jgi:flagellar biosynthesis protein FlhG
MSAPSNSTTILPGADSRAIAVVSGKGGSGKTIIAAVMAEILDAAGHSVILVDADTGTAGLTFYFGLELVTNTSVGLSDVLVDTWIDPDRILGLTRPIKDFKRTRFLSIGDYRRFPRDFPGVGLADLLGRITEILRASSEYVIFDCRGGLDDESLAVCKAVDDILLVVETDATSYQASQRLVDVLAQNNVSAKLKGFMINKVFDDPSVVARNGTAVFRTQYLTAIPFDFDAMRAFFVGKVPDLYSTFGVHVHHGLHKAYSDGVKEPNGRVYRFDEYSEIGFVNLDSLRGGIIVSLLLVAFSALLYTYWFRPESHAYISVPLAIGVLSVLGLMGSISSVRQAIGEAVNSLITKTLLIRRR